MPFALALPYNKRQIGRSVVEWVNISEYLLLSVF